MELFLIFFVPTSVLLFIIVNNIIFDRIRYKRFLKEKKEYTGKCDMEWK